MTFFRQLRRAFENEDYDKAQLLLSTGEASAIKHDLHLLRACSKRDLAELRKLITNGVYLEWFPMFKYAVSSDDVRAMKTLLKQVDKLDEKVKDDVFSFKRKREVLEYAVWRSCREIVVLLLETGMDVNAKMPNEEGRTPLHTACACDNMAMVKVLTQHGALLTAKSNWKDTPLSLAYDLGINMSWQIFSDKECFIHLDVEDQFYLFQEYYTETKTVQHLVEDNQEIVQLRNKEGMTFLHVASSRDLYDNYAAETCKVLLSAGTDVQAEDKRGETPLFRAGGRRVVRVLLAAGANVHHESQNGCTALHEARSAEVAKALIRAGADINAKDKSGRTPVWVMSSFERLDQRPCYTLINAGADTNIMNKHGHTPIQHLMRTWQSARETFEAKGYMLEHFKELEDKLCHMIKWGSAELMGIGKLTKQRLQLSYEKEDVRKMRLTNAWKHWFARQEWTVSESFRIEMAANANHFNHSSLVQTACFQALCADDERFDTANCWPSLMYWEYVISVLELDVLGI